MSQKTPPSPSSSSQQRISESLTWWRRTRRRRSAGWRSSDTWSTLSSPSATRKLTNCEFISTNTKHVLSLFYRLFSFLKTQFKNADVNNSKYLTFEEVKGLCKSLNIKISNGWIQSCTWARARRSTSGSLLCRSRSPPPAILLEEFCSTAWVGDVDACASPWQGEGLRVVGRWLGAGLSI